MLLAFCQTAGAQSHTCYSKEVDYKSAQHLFNLQEKYDVSASKAQYITPQQPYEGHIILEPGDEAVVCLITEKEADQVTITITKPDGQPVKDLKTEQPEHNAGIAYFTAKVAGTYIITCTVQRNSGFDSCAAVLSGKARQ